MNLNFSNNDLLINKYFIAFSTNFKVFPCCPCQMRFVAVKCQIFLIKEAYHNFFHLHVGSNPPQIFPNWACCAAYMALLSIIQLEEIEILFYFATNTINQTQSQVTTTLHIAATYYLMIIYYYLFPSSISFHTKCWIKSP